MIKPVKISYITIGESNNRITGAFQTIYMSGYRVPMIGKRDSIGYACVRSCIDRLTGAAYDRVLCVFDNREAATEYQAYSQRLGNSDRATDIIEIVIHA